MVFPLVAAYFAFRRSAKHLDALTSGLAVGLARFVKPANAIFLPAPALALAYSRRYGDRGASPPVSCRR
jgi:4-amino-4-deoxy-L-arabinose transferase-like glycosyltransferase